MNIIEQIKICINSSAKDEFRTQLLAYMECAEDFAHYCDELTEENEALKAQIRLIESVTDANADKVEELKAQIEKMKNCQNCNNLKDTGINCYCKLGLKMCKRNCKKMGDSGMTELEKKANYYEKSLTNDYVENTCIDKLIQQSYKDGYKQGQESMLFEFALEVEANYLKKIEELKAQIEKMKQTCIDVMKIQAGNLSNDYMAVC